MMARRGIQGSSNMAVLLQNDASFSQSFAGYLGPATSSAGYLSNQSLMNFAQGHCSRIRQPVFWPIELDEAANDELDDGLHHPEKKRRLTVDQVQFLEKSFEVENKLEPERKVQLAKDLGLHPRQVAIWFQNRRARWKTKHLEKEYEILKCSYDTLKIDYDNLLREKDELQAKVVSLSNMLHQKGKNDGKLELFECGKRQGKLLKFESEKKPMSVLKQEDISSGNSIVLDSESPRRYISGGYSMVTEPTCSSTAAFEPALSDQSQAGEVDEVKGCGFLALEDNSCNYDDIQVGEQTLWALWS